MVFWLGTERWGRAERSVTSRARRAKGSAMSFENVRAAIDEIAAGKMVILVDDEDRENEGDLCLAAERVTPEAINFMAKHGRGLICLTVTEARVKKLELPMMVDANSSPFQTGFTVSIEARSGVSTGISAADRAHTIRVAIDKNAQASDLVRPGHVFPIRARDGGVLVRAGQTEGSVDLARLAGLNPSGVICEIMNDDGTMARRAELEAFAREHRLRIVTIAELIQYRLAHESLVEVLAERSVADGPWGPLRVVVFRSIVDQQQHFALVKGALDREKPTLVRVQSVELPRDLVPLVLSGGGAELRAAMSQIEAAGSGVFVHLVRSSGAPLAEKLTEASPAKGDGPERIGRRLDLREFGTGAQILKALGVGKFRLLTNSEFKLVGLEGFDLELVERVPLFPA
jgi:3,4-dihydroxy 2-butanone 4-phosphate synthase/GTP cyclohydrolase II